MEDEDISSVSADPESELPSTYDKEHWIYVINRSGVNNDVTENESGKWLIFVDPKDVDAAWDKVKNATKEGRLGCYSKVSTQRRCDIFRESKDSVIGVYTHDWRNENDVMRVREVLRELGFTKTLFYKKEEDTRAGRYAAVGCRRLSVYRS